MRLDRRKFFKTTGLLAGLAVLNPLKALGLFKPKPALSMETMKAAFDQVNVCGDGTDGDYIYFTSPEPIKNIYVGHKEPYYWYRGTFNPDVSGEVKALFHFNGKQWIPVED